MLQVGWRPPPRAPKKQIVQFSTAAPGTRRSYRIIAEYSAGARAALHRRAREAGIAICARGALLSRRELQKAFPRCPLGRRDEFLPRARWVARAGERWPKGHVGGAAITERVLKASGGSGHAVEGRDTWGGRGGPRRQRSDGEGGLPLPDSVHGSRAEGRHHLDFVGHRPSVRLPERLTAGQRTPQRRNTGGRSLAVVSSLVGPLLLSSLSFLSCASGAESSRERLPSAGKGLAPPRSPR